MSSREVAALREKCGVRKPMTASDELRFMARLVATRVMLVTEGANREAHGGRLRPPRTPLRLRHYKSAIEAQLAGRP